MKVQKIKYTEEFHQTHECRLSNLPLILMDALRQIGPVPWRGIQAIEGYDIFDITNQESNNEIKTYIIGRVTPNETPEENTQQHFPKIAETQWYAVNTTLSCVMF